MTNKLLVFDDNQNNIMSNEEYSSNLQRVDGIKQYDPAYSNITNKVLHQVSAVAHCIGNIISTSLGVDIDDTNMEQLQSNMNEYFLGIGKVKSVDGYTPDENGNIQLSNIATEEEIRNLFN